MNTFSYLGCACLALTLILTGCSDSEQISPETEKGQFDFREGFYKVDLDEGSFELIAPESIKTSVDQTITERNPNSIVKGKYLTQGGHNVRLNAVSNPGGVHGSGSIVGPVYIDVQFDTDCVFEVGSRAVVGGVVTYAELGDNPFAIPIEPGWFMYFAVDDLGKSKKDPLDQYHNEVYLGAPGLGSFCELLNPDNPFIWLPDEWLDVAGRNDYIIVK